MFKRDVVNIAEAAFRWENCFVRADIIEKKGNLINLIEVKAKSWNPAEDSFMQKRGKDKVNSDILEYVYDVAFQKYVIQNALGPLFKVKAFLMLADKTAIADYDGINQLFQLVKVDKHHNKVVRKPGTKLPALSPNKLEYPTKSSDKLQVLATLPLKVCDTA